MEGQGFCPHLVYSLCKHFYSITFRMKSMQKSQNTGGQKEQGSPPPVRRVYSGEGQGRPQQGGSCFHPCSVLCLKGLPLLLHPVPILLKDQLPTQCLITPGKKLHFSYDLNYIVWHWGYLYMYILCPLLNYEILYGRRCHTFVFPILSRTVDMYSVSAY
jgi:hypothetical protein